MAEIDVAQLFAPLDPSVAFDVVLREARDVLGQVRTPVDAELWGSDMIGALAGAKGPAGEPQLMTELTDTLVPAAERNATADSLALLRILGAIGSPLLSAAASAAADRMAAGGVAEPEWAHVIGSPAVGTCWHYGDVGGRQESVTVTFGYGSAEHALSVLIDHGKGGKIRDAWVADAKGLLDKTWLAADADPLIVFETIAPGDAHDRLAKAIAAGEAPATPDETDDLTAHRALLHARLPLLAAR